MKEIKIISSSNCGNCELLYNVVSTIVKSKGIDAKVEKVIDVRELAKYGVMRTPLLVVNGKLKHVGTPIPDPQTIEELINQD
ncbi:thioredoxin family protein [Sulfurihydrogenibium sp.]|uniref:thioredoxin family protein n=1 Tax=Sulfurihydrogenibium sp. TaxID=2053621 RepID=UPI0026331573|nr:thioredoxin family protein [Sulfurihydrogenibium sp.]